MLIGTSIPRRCGFIAKSITQDNPIHEGFSRFDIDEPYNIPAVIDPADS